MAEDPPSVPTARTGAVIRELFRAGSMETSLGELLEEMGRHGRTVRGWFQEADLPSPRRWLAVAACVRAALRLQREPDRSLLEVARDEGYSDHSALSRQMNRLFGSRPVEVRRRLGWEWMLDRWLRREGHPGSGA